MTKLELSFHINAVLLCKTCNVVKPGAWLARPPPGAQQSQDFSPILTVVLQVLHSQQAVTHSLSQSGQSLGRSEAGSEACSALSLKPKQDCSFNFPDRVLQLLILCHCFSCVLQLSIICIYFYIHMCVFFNFPREDLFDP